MVPGTESRKKEKDSTEEVRRSPLIHIICNGQSIVVPHSQEEYSLLECSLLQEEHMLVINVASKSGNVDFVFEELQLPSTESAAQESSSSHDCSDDSVNLMLTRSFHRQQSYGLESSSLKVITEAEQSGSCFPEKKPVLVPTPNQVAANAVCGSHETLLRTQSDEPEERGLDDCHEQSLPGTELHFDDHAAFTHLQMALGQLRSSLSKFSTRFRDSVAKKLGNSELQSWIQSWFPGLEFRPNLQPEVYAITAVINEGIFTNFNKQDFADGETELLGYMQRCLRSWEYLEDNKNFDISDETSSSGFASFRDRKFHWLTNKFNLVDHDQCQPINGKDVLQKLGGSRLYREFSTVLTHIWLLHKSAFAFEVPPRILSFLAWSNVDVEYMEIVNEDTKLRAPLLVGFTTGPGLQVGRNVIKAQIYAIPY